MDNKYLEITFNNKSFKLKSALVGGIVYNDPEYPCAMYAGNVSHEQVGMALLHALRACMKINMDVHDMTLEESQDFVLFCLYEAVKREEKRITDPTYAADETVFRMTEHN